ncbi:MAG TPA: nodulation protein NfeD, partial [Anaerolineaceae bacterium]|nr:nodulation protein NfeD [Anaerolineaceae bacterium]
MKPRLFRLGTLWLILLLFALPAGVQAQSESGRAAIEMEANGPLTPAMAGYIERGLTNAVERQAEVVILRLNTPGGSIDLMNAIIQDLRASPIPVIVYVAPRGAIAGSAGTLITLAGHKAAMAPETAIGAASPVGAQGEDIGETMEAKVTEIMKASARSLAETRGPEAVRLAEETIENARAVSASEALDAGLIDYVATSTEDLLQQLDGTTALVDGREVTLRTTGLVVEPVESSFVEQLLQFLTNPNLVLLLLAIGVQAILIELSSPGGWVAGFIGVVSLLLAIYGLGVLPVNWFGILFLVLAFALFVLELKTATFGALTTAGVASFIAGALILFNSVRVPGIPRVSIPLVIGMALFFAATSTVVLGFVMRAMRRPPSMGKQVLVGRTGTVRESLDPVGSVQVAGELWTA